MQRSARFRTFVVIVRAQIGLQRLLSRYVSITMIEAVNELERENVALESFCVAAVSEKALANAADVP